DEPAEKEQHDENRKQPELLAHSQELPKLHQKIHVSSESKLIAQSLRRAPLRDVLPHRTLFREAKRQEILPRQSRQDSHRGQHAEIHDAENQRLHDPPERVTEKRP